MRVKSMERTRQALEKLQLRIAAGKLKQPEKIGAAAERLLQRSHGYCYYSVVSTKNRTTTERAYRIEK